MSAVETPRPHPIADYVPAQVFYYPGRRAAVTHPSGDYYHINAIQTRQRLARQGYTIVPFVPEKVAE